MRNRIHKTLRGPTVATCEGHNHTWTAKTSRVGIRQATAMADALETFTEAHVNKDGSGFVQVLRNGTNVRLVFGKQNGRRPGKVMVQLVEAGKVLQGNVRTLLREA